MAEGNGEGHAETPEEKAVRIRDTLEGKTKIFSDFSSRLEQIAQDIDVVRASDLYGPSKAREVFKAYRYERDIAGLDRDDVEALFIAVLQDAFKPLNDAARRVHPLIKAYYDIDPAQKDALSYTIRRELESVFRGVVGVARAFNGRFCTGIDTTPESFRRSCKDLLALLEFDKAPK